MLLMSILKKIMSDPFNGVGSYRKKNEWADQVFKWPPIVVEHEFVSGPLTGTIQVLKDLRINGIYHGDTVCLVMGLFCEMNNDAYFVILPSGTETIIPQAMFHKKQNI